MKRTFVLLIASALFAISAAAQKKVQESYTQQALQFISSIKTLKGTVLLDDAQQYKGTFLSEVLADTMFTKKELRHIKKMVNSPPIKKWTTQLLPGTRIFDKDQLEERRKKDYKGYQIYTSPIFLRKGSYCLFYFASNCGGICGMGRMRLFYNFGGKWVIVKTYGYWIS